MPVSPTTMINRNIYIVVHRSSNSETYYILHMVREVGEGHMDYERELMSVSPRQRLVQWVQQKQWSREDWWNELVKALLQRSHQLGWRDPAGALECWYQTWLCTGITWEALTTTEAWISRQKSVLLGCVCVEGFLCRKMSKSSLASGECGVAFQRA